MDASLNTTPASKEEMVRVLGTVEVLLQRRSSWIMRTRNKFTYTMRSEVL